MTWGLGQAVLFFWGDLPSGAAAFPHGGSRARSAKEIRRELLAPKPGEAPPAEGSAKGGPRPLRAFVHVCGVCAGVRACRSVDMRRYVLVGDLMARRGVV